MSPGSSWDHRFLAFTKTEDARYQAGEALDHDQRWWFCSSPKCTKRAVVFHLYECYTNKMHTRSAMRRRQCCADHAAKLARKHGIEEVPRG